MKINEVNYDRPLTAEEKVFSADLENYNQLFKYMQLYKLDKEEWYDILILHYLRAVKKYLNIPRLQQYEFSTILFRTLDSARSNYYKAMTTQKRMPEGGFCSLNLIIDGSDGKDFQGDASVQEAAEYFGFSDKKIRKIIDEHETDNFVLWNGTRPRIKRQLFEKFVDEKLNSI